MKDSEKGMEKLRDAEKERERLRQVEKEKQKLKEEEEKQKLIEAEKKNAAVGQDAKADEREVEIEILPSSGRDDDRMYENEFFLRQLDELEEEMAEQRKEKERKKEETKKNWNRK